MMRLGTTITLRGGLPAMAVTTLACASAASFA
jgi:hypothetical protein